MAPLNKEQKANIVPRIAFAETELADLGKIIPLSFDKYNQDRVAQRNVERILENVINACIDIAKIILAGEEIEIPSTYADTFIALGNSNIIEKDLAHKMASLVKDRNILAHEYLDLKWEMINSFIKTGKAEVEKFFKKTKELIKYVADLPR